MGIIAFRISWNIKPNEQWRAREKTSLVHSQQKQAILQIIQFGCFSDLMEGHKVLAKVTIAIDSNSNANSRMQST